MDHEQLVESLSLYALGTLEPDSAREVESHLASGCPPCSALLRQYQGTAAMLPYALTLKTPQ
ncbi:MAG: zf-HC2 domain-containing protein, partial [Nitrospirae bacterium]|nr:zf-HC2 domain-containing protein [Nitrospirota bacterium]